MDYTTQEFYFKLKKTARYIRLYGVQRTLMKVKGQYHMKKKFAALPAIPSPLAGGGHVGLIGCGNYAFTTIAYYLQKVRGRVMRAAMDIDVNKAASLCRTFDLRYYTDNAQALIDDPAIDLVFIASNHASHAEYAIRCIRAGKHVHIEKPHVVSDDQLERLVAAMREHPNVNVYLGFNRPRSQLFTELQGALQKQSGPLMINWFLAGHEIPDDHWYFDEKEGGRVLGNLCHWTDLTLRLVGMENAFPCTIVPATPAASKSDYVVSLIFADRSCASITFSAKGHTFEGVREVLNVHKGNLLANLSDFHSLTIDEIDRKTIRRSLYRDHGHGANVFNSEKNFKSEAVSYVQATARLFLEIRKAIDSGNQTVLTRAQAVGHAQ